VLVHYSIFDYKKGGRSAGLLVGDIISGDQIQTRPGTHLKNSTEKGRENTQSANSKNCSFYFFFFSTQAFMTLNPNLPGDSPITKSTLSMISKRFE
jgi:hypothetical protein